MKVKEVCGLRVAYRMVMALTLIWCATSSWAQTARYEGMGGASIAVSDDAAAVLVNPAGLGLLSLAPGRPSKAIITAGVGDVRRADLEVAHVLAAYRLGGSGIGAAYQRATFTGNQLTVLSGGYGWRVFGPLVAGISASSLRTDTAGPSVNTDTIVNAGGLFTLAPFGSIEARVGVVVRDLLNEAGTSPDLGASLRIGQSLLVAADVEDAFDDSGRILRYGLEAYTPSGIIIRMGSNNGEPTLGAGYVSRRFRVDASWLDADNGQHVLNVTASVAY